MRDEERQVQEQGDGSARYAQRNYRTVPDVPRENPRRGNHPWVELSTEDDSLGEAVRYSLDEIRYA